MLDFETKKTQILDRVELLDVVSDHVALKRSGQRWVGLCPFHNEKTPSFTVSPDQGFFKCFGCGKGGDVFSFVQFRENVPFIEAMRMLADRAGVELDASTGAASSGPTRADVARVNEWAARFFRARLQDDLIGRSAREYVDGRGISAEMQERFAIGLAVGGDSAIAAAAAKAGIEVDLLVAADLVRRSERGQTYDTFRDRLIFPIRDASKRVVGFGGRTLVDDRAKYLNTRQNILFDKGRGLYGVDLARDAIVERGRSVVVEGYTDVVAAHQAGITETVATLGTALTDSQVDLLRRYSDRIIVLFDSDDAGEAAADRAISVALPRCVNVMLARVPDGKDPAEWLGNGGVSAFSDVLNDATEALQFKWQETVKRFARDDSSKARHEAVLEFLRVVAGGVDTHAVDPIQRGLLINQVAHLLRMDGAEIDRMMVRLSSGRYGAKATSSDPTGPAGEAKPRSMAKTGAAAISAEQAAWTRLLEVILNEPGVLSRLDELPVVDRIGNVLDRQIAQVCVDLFRTLGEYRLADVLASFSEPEDVARVTELSRAGARRGNFDGTFEQAMDRIASVVAFEASDTIQAESPGDGDGGQSTTDGRARLQNVSDGAKQHRSYAPRRLIRGLSKQ